MQTQPIVIALSEPPVLPEGYQSVTLRDGNEVQHFAVKPHPNCKVCRGSCRYSRLEMDKNNQPVKYVCNCVANRLRAFLAAGAKMQEQAAQTIASAPVIPQGSTDSAITPAPAAEEARAAIASARRQRAEEQRANLCALLAAAEAAQEEALAPHRAKLVTLQREHASLTAHAEAQKEMASRCTAAAAAFREHAAELRRRAAEVEAEARGAEGEAVAFGVKAVETSTQAVLRQRDAAKVEGEIAKIEAHHMTRIRRLQRKLKGAGGTVEVAGEAVR